MTPEEVHKLGVGLYHVYWAEGGHSYAAIGMQTDGTKWLAPINWVAPIMDPPWAEIDRVERVMVFETLKARENPDHDFHLNFDLLPKPHRDRVGKILDALDERPNLLLALAHRLPEAAKTVLGPWEHTINFGGALVRIRFGDDLATPTILITPEDGGWVTQSQGAPPGIYPTAREAMDALDEVFRTATHFTLARGRPTAGPWEQEDAENWIRPQVFPRVNKAGAVGSIFGFERQATYGWSSFDMQRQKHGGSSETLAEAQRLCDQDLLNAGWTLQEGTP